MLKLSDERDTLPFIELIALVFFVMIMALFSMLALLVIGYFFNISYTEIAAIINQPNKTDISLIKWIQAVQTVLLFLVPPLLVAVAMRKNTRTYLGIARIKKAWLVWLTPLSIICALPFVNFLAHINSQMSLPDFMQNIESWMTSKEQYAQRLTELLVQTDNVYQLLANVVVIAILPAVAEEFMFRGALQPILGRITRNMHLGIILSAILFSAIHLQFFGFFPRMILGIVFGYLFYWSGSLWIPILAHFSNNFFGVLYYHFYEGDIASGYMNEIGTTPQTYYLLFLSILLTTVILLKYRNYYLNKQPS